MRKRINKILWYGDSISGGKALPPSASSSPDGLDGLNEGELYISNNESDPCIFILTSSKKVVRIGVDIEKLKSLFLSKTEDDSASGVINFEKGITFGDGEMTLALDSDGCLSLTRKDGAAATFYATGGVSALGEGIDGGGGGASTLGELLNVNDDVDDIPADDVVLIREAGDTHWSKKRLSDILDEHVSSDKNYVHYQDAPSDSWSITHSMNKYPSVSIVDSGGSVVFGEVVYNSLSSLTLNFNGGFSGKAILN